MEAGACVLALAAQATLVNNCAYNITITGACFYSTGSLLLYISFAVMPHGRRHFSVLFLCPLWVRSLLGGRLGSWCHANLIACWARQESQLGESERSDFYLWR